MPQLVQFVRPDQGLLFRITHRDNIGYILRHGLWCQSSAQQDPGFVSIGHSEIIVRRKTRAVEVPPGGVLADYVPFYFTPRTPMLHNIVTGYGGVTRRERSEIVVLVTSLERLASSGCDHVLADRNAALRSASFWRGDAIDHGDRLQALPWSDWQASDYRHDPDRPDKAERYQAEVLVHRGLPVTALLAIITHDSPTAERLRHDVAAASCAVRVEVRPAWYP